MKTREFINFWKLRNAVVTRSLFDHDNKTHYFVRSWDLYGGSIWPIKLDPNLLPPIVMVYTKKEIDSLTEVDLEEQYVSRQLTLAFC
jgi:hypothetical protein